ncbi:type II and III secretion system protein family protein [Stieleria mannarensis]|uniref:type II and III secretion system protein family protein n=1 Tax=Stieleria mannarensis TaxID=2755585 RepID=UPI001600829F|nr:pilus assembly protein N-terminal domain-containing protein [Rhodopirellula sp. JC639]
MPTPRLQARRLLSFVTACMLWCLAIAADGQAPIGDRPPARPEPTPRSFRPAPPRRLPPNHAVGSAAEAEQVSETENRYLLERIDPEKTLDLVQGRPTVLRFRVPPFRDQVGDPEVAELVSITESEISVTGKQTGSTTVNFWFKSPETGQQEVLSYLVRVTDDPEQSRQFERLLEALQRDINRGFPNSVVELSYVGSQVVVRGKARDIEDATNILRIVSQSLPEEEQAEEAALWNNADPNNAPVGFQPNTSAEAFSGFTIDEMINAGGLDNVFQGKNITGANAVNINNRVVNMLEIAGIHQVMLKVTLAEVVRDSGRSLISTTRFGVDSDTASNVSFTQTLGVGELTFQTDQFFLQFDALKRLGLARSLSEPNLTTLSGQPASFLVGGQFPILESTSTVAAVNQNIRFIPFGVQLNVLPTVTDGDRIRLQLQTVVSETSDDGLGTGGSNNDNDDENDPSQPPSLSTRLFTSTVELRDGESLALAGLIRNSLVNSSLKVPFLGDIPVVGNLFANNRASYQEQELLVVVTPHLVSPLPAGAALPLPGSDTFDPDDLDFFLRGSIEGTIAEDYRTPVRGGVHRMNAFRRCEQKYIIGMPGHSSGRPLPNLQMPPHTTPEILTGEALR